MLPTFFCDGKVTKSHNQILNWVLDLLWQLLENVGIRVFLILSTCSCWACHVFLHFFIQVVKYSGSNVRVNHLQNVVFVVREVNQTLGDLGLVLKNILIYNPITPSSMYLSSNLMISVSLKSSLFFLVEVYERIMSSALSLVYSKSNHTKTYFQFTEVLKYSLDLFFFALLYHLLFNNTVYNQIKTFLMGSCSTRELEAE